MADFTANPATLPGAGGTANIPANSPLYGANITTTPPVTPVKGAAATTPPPSGALTVGAGATKTQTKPGISGITLPSSGTALPPAVANLNTAFGINKPTVPPAATMTANITTPKAGTTVPPPVVSNSTTAASHLANAKDQTAKLAADVISQKTATTPQPTTPTDTSSSSDTKTAAASLTDQLSGLVDELNTDSDAAQTATDQALNDNDAAIAAEQADEDAANAANVAKLQQISTGTYPLSPAESAMMSSTMDSYASILQAQQTANTAITGSMTEAMASLGINVSAPVEAMGLISSTINEGNSKIADITGKMTQAVSKLQLSFQTNDFNETQSAWNDLSKSYTDRIATLTKLQSDIQTQGKDLQTQITNNIKAATTAIVDATKSDQGQQKIDTATATAQLNSWYKHALIDEKTYKDGIAAIGANTTAGRLAAATSQFAATFVPGATMADGTPTVDQNGNITPDALKAAIADAPNEGMTRADFIKAFGSQLYAPKGVVSSAYGLTPAEAKTVTGVLPPTS